MAPSILASVASLEADEGCICNVTRIRRQNQYLHRECEHLLAMLLLRCTLHLNEICLAPGSFSRVDQFNKIVSSTAASMTSVAINQKRFYALSTVVLILQCEAWACCAGHLKFPAYHRAFYIVLFAARFLHLSYPIDTALPSSRGLPRRPRYASRPFGDEDCGRGNEMPNISSIFIEKQIHAKDTVFVVNLASTDPGY